MAQSIQKSYTLNAATNALARFRMVTHCYAASFLRKTILCKTNNIFYSLGNQKLDKTIADPKSTLKINMRSRWTVFQILLRSAVIWI